MAPLRGLGAIGFCGSRTPGGRSWSVTALCRGIESVEPSPRTARSTPHVKCIAMMMMMMMLEILSRASWSIPSIHAVSPPFTFVNCCRTGYRGAHRPIPVTCGAQPPNSLLVSSDDGHAMPVSASPSVGRSVGPWSRRERQHRRSSALVSCTPTACSALRFAALCLLLVSRDGDDGGSPPRRRTDRSDARPRRCFGPSAWTLGFCRNEEVTDNVDPDALGPSAPV